MGKTRSFILKPISMRWLIGRSDTNDAGRLRLSNAGSYYFEDRSDLSQLDEIDWDAVQARQWQNCKERKQAEFLLEHSFPFNSSSALESIRRTQYQQVVNTLPDGGHRPNVEICPDWYY